MELSDTLVIARQAILAVPRTQRITLPTAALCAADPGPFMQGGLVTVPVLRSGMKDAASHPGQE
jgi:hypothetical protein